MRLVTPLDLAFALRRPVRRPFVPMAPRSVPFAWVPERLAACDPLALAGLFVLWVFCNPSFSIDSDPSGIGGAIGWRRVSRYAIIPCACAS